MVQFDRQYFRQIVHNILTNAIRHGAGPILVRCRQAGAAVSLSCINKVNPGTKSSTLGAGLGLRLIQGLAGAVPGASFHTSERRGHFIACLQLTPASTVTLLEDNPGEKTTNLLERNYISKRANKVPPVKGWK
jgi:K+-sensing histidine kinase KdpD